MLINSEADLVDSYLNNLKREENIKIVTELETNFGRPDIVVIFFNKSLLERRQMERYEGQFLRKYSYILAHLYGKSWVSVRELKRFFNLSDKELDSSIDNLVDMKLLDIKEGLVKSRPAKEILVIKRIRVIEAKLTNWKYVIEQAERHFWFTNESTILLPNFSNNIITKSKKECKKNDVGLSVVELGRNKELLKPKSKKLVNTPLLWELNEKLIKGEI